MSILRTFVYDAENKPVEVKNSSNATIGEYFYNGDGLRIKKVVPGTGETTIFAYDASNRLVAEYSTAAEPAATAKTSYLTTDHLGSPRVVTDQFGHIISRRDFMPFGEEISTAERTAALGYQPDTVRQKFTGYERDDETDLDYAKARMYSTILGRFTAVDPLRANVPLADPQMFNRFSYVRGSPTKFVDPLGLVRDDPGWVIDGGQCAKRNGRCIKGGLSPLTADLEGPIGTDYSATILVPNALISQLDRDAEIFYSLALSVGKKLLFALEQVSATRTMINRNHNNVFNSLFGINSSDVLQYSRLNDGTYLAGPDVTFQLGIEASPVGSSMSITYSIKGVFDEYNVARRELNEQYNIAKAAFVAAWSDVVVPVERSDLGYRTANLTRDYLESLYEKRVGTAFSRGELKGLSESSVPPLPGGF